MRNSNIALSAALLFAAPCGVRAAVPDFDGGPAAGLAVPAAPAPVPAPSAPARAEAEWTVLAFLNAKNNLEANGLADLNEMELAGSSDRVNIVAELGRIKGNDAADGDWTGSRRYFVTKDADAAKINSRLLAEIPVSDMGDWRHLAEFIAWGKQNYPAKHYLVIVWNHGNGWKDRAPAQRGLSNDDETGNHITTAQLGAALAQAGKIDIFAMDACIMQMAEVAWEARNTADFILASEEVVPNEGQRYDIFLSALLAAPAITPEELGKTAVKVYADHYESIKRYGTMSLVRAPAMPGFAALLDGWTDAVRAKSEKLAVADSRKQAQQFWYDDNIDIYHLVQLTNSYPYLNKLVAEKGKALLEFMDRELIVSSRAISSQYKNAHGLAIYAPKAWLDPAYKDLPWSAATKWDEFCAWLLSGH